MRSGEPGPTELSGNCQVAPPKSVSAAAGAAGRPETCAETQVRRTCWPPATMGLAFLCRTVMLLLGVVVAARAGLSMQDLMAGLNAEHDGPNCDYRCADGTVPDSDKE